MRDRRDLCKRMPSLVKHELSVGKLAELVLQWACDPVLFVKDMFGAEPTEQQQEMLKGACPLGAHLSVKSGHGCGKSTCFAWLALWGLVCFPDIKIGCTAPTSHQLQDVLWPEIKKWRGEMIEPWRSDIEVTVDKVTVKSTGCFAVARTARKDNPDAMQGLHSPTMMFLIDEASGVHDIVFEVAQGTLSTPGARVIMAGNPTKTTGYFYRSFKADRDYWERVTFNCEDSPLVAKQYINQMRDEYGVDSDIYRVRVLGEFPVGGDMQFIGVDAAEAAMKRQAQEDSYLFAPVLLGVDVAWYGGDMSVIFMRQGVHSEIVWSNRGVDPTTLSGIVASYEDKLKADAVFIDRTGIGAGVVSNLMSLGRNPIGVDFGSSSSRQQFLNKRAECWSNMKEWLTDGQGCIPDNDRLKDDLTGVEYQFNMTGKLQLERKETMRKRGLSSPDFADALAMTFAFPVKPTGKKFANIELALNGDEIYNPFEFKGALLT